MKKETIMTGLIILALCLSFLTQPACGPASGQKGGTSEAYDRLLIKKVTLKSFPARKPDGRPWDNRWASYDPDIYIVLLDDKDGSVLFSNPKNRVENASSNGEASFHLNYTLSDLENSYTVAFYDFDSLTEQDIIGQMTFQPYAHEGDTTIIARNKGSEIELEVEWLSKN